ncbi:MAG: sulfatase-like hydrolase/transferase [Prevotella sp.]|nr:sulfatase-like hydrolase/transferase [Prevotella sp.]
MTKDNEKIIIILMKINLPESPYLPYYQRVSYLYIPALYVVTTVLLDVVMYINLHWAFPPAYIFSLSLILMIAALVCLCRHKWLQTVLCSLLLGLHLTTTISNIIAYNTCTEIFSLETIMSLGTAFHNAEAIVLDLWFLVPIIALVVGYIVAVVLVMWFCRLPRHRSHTPKRAYLCGLLALISFFGYTVAYSGLPAYPYGVDYYFANHSNQKYLYDTFGSRVLTLRTFGSYSFYLDNLIYLLGGKADLTTVLGLDEYVTDEFKPNEFALNADEVLGEGYNLIMVLMETFEREAVNPITMPNLYQFMQQSCVEVNGYYSMERTCFTDYIGQTGMNALGKEWWSNYYDVPVTHSLANIFNRSNYVTQTFHNTDGNCYQRNDWFEPTLGFQKFNNYTTYLPADQQYDEYALNPDELLFKKNLDKIAPSDQNFYSYIISASTHALNPKYDFHDYYPAAMAYIEQPANWEKLTQMFPTLLSADVNKKQLALNYLAGTYSFDQGFGALIDHLKTTRGKDGRLLIETTALVLFGDHYYYANPGVLIDTETPSIIGNRCPFIVYNPRAIAQTAGNTTITQAENAIQPQPAQCGTTLNRFTSTMDIYPTVCSLFGVVTDQQLTYGHSIFDRTPSIGVGYMNGYTWGSNGYDAANDDWRIWCTVDFQDYLGEDISDEQLPQTIKTINRTYACIHTNMLWLDQNKFQDLAKAQAYHLRTA